MTVCLVLGGGGFLGSHVLDELTCRGWEAWVMDRRPSFNKLMSSKAVRWVEADFAQVEDWTTRLIGTDVIFHCLSTTSPATSNDEPVFDIQSNLIPTVKLLTGAAQARVKKVVFFSSGGTVYGVPRKLPISETHPTDPICSYGIVKLALEKYLQLFRHLYGLDYLIVRLSNPYGERQNPSGAQGAVVKFLYRLAEGSPIQIWGDGSVIRDYIYVKDAILGVFAALERSESHRLFNLGTGQGTSLSELLSVIEEVTGFSDQVEYLPPRLADVPINVLDISRLCSVTDWRPTTDLVSGITRTWTSMQRDHV